LRFWLQTIELEILCHTRGMPKTYPRRPEIPTQEKSFAGNFWKLRQVCDVRGILFLVAPWQRNSVINNPTTWQRQSNRQQPKQRGRQHTQHLSTCRHLLPKPQHFSLLFI